MGTSHSIFEIDFLVAKNDGPLPGQFFAEDLIVEDRQKNEYDWRILKRILHVDPEDQNEPARSVAGNFF